jgi:hypothetical protein
MGRPWNPNFAEGDADSGKMPLEQIAETFVKFVGFVEPLLTSLLDSQTSSHSDDLGFKQPTGDQNKQRGGVSIDAVANPLRTFFKELFDAVEKDLGMMKRTPEEDMS